jgi:hypothetical protein
MKDDMLYVGYFSKKEKKKREERPYIKQPKKKERERKLAQTRSLLRLLFISL